MIFAYTFILSNNGKSIDQKPSSTAIKLFVGENNEMYYPNPRRVGYIDPIHGPLDGPLYMG